MKVTDFQIEELIRAARFRSVNPRLTRFAQDQALEVVEALTELLKLRRGIPVEGVVS